MTINRPRYCKQFWFMFVGLVISSTGTTMIWPFLTIYASAKLSMPIFVHSTECIFFPAVVQVIFVTLLTAWYDGAVVFNSLAFSISTDWAVINAIELPGLRSDDTQKLKARKTLLSMPKNELNRKQTMIQALVRMSLVGYYPC